MRAAILAGHDAYVLRFACPAIPFTVSHPQPWVLKGSIMGKQQCAAPRLGGRTRSSLEFTSESYPKSAEPIVQNARTEAFT